MTEKRFSLNRNQIKYIVVITMIIDHIAWSFVDRTNPYFGGVMHLIGRLTGATMAKAEAGLPCINGFSMCSIRFIWLYSAF